MHQLVLVVDDSMLIRHTVCRFLEERGFGVESAANGLEALEMLKTIVPSLIIIDLQMPKMDGRQLMDALKSRPETANVPIVVLAARRSPLDAPPENHSPLVIYKEMDIEAQLADVMETILPRRTPPA
jgi:CheY-like chemotaxis protein